MAEINGQIRPLGREPQTVPVDSYAPISESGSVLHEIDLTVCLEADSFLSLVLAGAFVFPLPTY